MDTASIIQQYTSLWYLVTWGLSAIGTWKILNKCGFHGFWALIPGFREFKTAEAAGAGMDGFWALILNIPVFIAEYFIVPMLGEDTREAMFVTVFILAGFIAILIFETRIYLSLCRTFGRTRLWTILWILAEFIPAIIWGFGGSFEPVHLGEDEDEDSLAGTAPADLNIYRPIVPKDDEELLRSVLYIDVKSRSVRDFARKRYLLKDISMVIPDKSMVLLLGGSGSGKTTLVNAVTGYEQADATILLHGKDVYKDYDSMKYRIGFVPQADLMRLSDTVKHTIYDAARMRLPLSVKRRELKNRVNDVTDALGITVGENALISKKSGGQKKRISIGMELVSDPELFILDEPDSGLDGVIARELFTRLRQIADSGKIVVAITHTPDRVVDLFSHVIVLAKDSGRVGRLAFYGTPEEAREFFGCDTMEEIIMAVNRVEDGGLGKADEFIAKYADWARAKGGESFEG